jgi:23S rRNA pseudouridine1911/1915/1917 synthase
MPGCDESFVIEKSLPRERLDLFLRTRFSAVSRGTIQRLIEGGHIRVDGSPIKPTHHPRAGEKITIHWPEARPAEAQPENIPLEILFEDDALLVVNKAPGQVVHPAAGNPGGTLVNALLHHCAGNLSGIGGVARPGVVHRLDKDTSGCLVVAKDDSTHLALAKQFSERMVKKIYHAIVCGRLTRVSGEMRSAIARDPVHRRRMAVVARGREAWTSFRVLKNFAEATHVEADLHTGRTHQIRVHFSHLGFPVVGDTTYGRRQNLRLTERTGFAAPRQMLHAHQLSFRHPRTGGLMNLEAPLPLDFREALESLHDR